MIILKIRDISLQFASNICFENFSSQIIQGQKIAVIGNNGSGKSSLLKLLRNEIEPICGCIDFNSDLQIEYVDQIIECHTKLSGGERFNKEFFQKIELSPDLLMLDEPTNHLDLQNRESLISIINSLSCAVIFATHDKDLISQCAEVIWHIDKGVIHQFRGKFDEYIRKHENEKYKIELKLRELNRESCLAHNKLMQEQERAKKSKQYGRNKYRGDKINLSSKKRKGETTTGNRKAAISDYKNELREKMELIYEPKKIVPKFAFDQQKIRTDRNILEIRDGSIGYRSIILKNISLQLAHNQRMAIKGRNGSGKTTLMKAIMSDNQVFIQGEWITPQKKDIGYLDQFYKNFIGITPFDEIKHNMPNASDSEIRQHLNCYLFRSNDQVYASIRTLSGGERARLSIAAIASRAFKLLVLDEPTNNIDMETASHLIDVLNNYSGSLIVISHDNNFLQQIGVESEYHLD